MTAKQTFINLSEERQKEIRDAAYMEFTRSNYKNASLSTIVKKLGLAKGSFYRYFSSKKELYMYLLEYAGNIRYNEIDTLSETLPKTIEELLVENFKNKISYDKKFPLYSGFLYRVVLEKDNGELEEIISTLKKQILDKTKEILKKYLAKKMLSSDIDVDATAFAIMHLQIGIYEFLSLKYKIDFIKNVQEGKPVFSMKDKNVLDAVKSFARIITRGINR